MDGEQHYYQNVLVIINIMIITDDAEHSTNCISHRHSYGLCGLVEAQTNKNLSKNRGE